ncbi:DNA cytosine methyltransferase [Oceaniglobus indicus]|uniref:DNA cytosine methyltransferase n=1 Tax=Oceaniglobus indicus TaxID=2047749 RepID=UPI001F4E128C|nr:DNA cytosine methyltransferase [Oceaniglobus indicus]
MSAVCLCIWAEQVKPDVILMENVEEFLTWGPLGEDGQPMKEFAGMTFDAWVKRLRRAGYRVQWRELRACDYGAPTIRKRFFMVARRDGLPITWPKPTHGDPRSSAVKRGKLAPWRTAAECIDWSLPCPSIFDDAATIKERHGLRAIRPLAKNTLARVARGMKRYVLDSADPFIVGVGGRMGQSNERPVSGTFQTITAKADSCIVAPSITRFNGGATGQDLRAPMATVTANSYIQRPGGCAPYGIIAPVLTYAQQGGNNRNVTDPHHTICASNKDQNAVIAPSLMSLKGTARRDSTADAPHPTVLAGGGHSALISPSLISIAHGDSGGRREYPLSETMGVVTSGGIAHALVAPTLVQTGYGEAPGQAPRALDIGLPLGTVVAGGVKHATAAAFLAQHNTGVTGHDAREPMSTVAATGSHQTPIAAWFAKYYGTGDGARTDEPMHTVTVKDRMGHMQAELGAPPFTEAHAARAREVAAFLRAHDAWDAREFVTLDIDGATYVIVDIGMRMLTPRELFRAQGFPPDYVIEGYWSEANGEWAWHPFPKNVQVSCCGNSVCPPLAEALVRANCADLALQQMKGAA